MKRFLLWSSLGLLALILLLVTASALLLGWLKWSGDSDWNRVQAGLRAKGEKLTFAELIPPPPPDSENFFADPIWQELTNHRILKEKQRINQWDTPLSESEQVRIKSLTQKNFHSRKDAIQHLEVLLRKKSANQDQQPIARLTLDLEIPVTSLLAHVAELSKRPSGFFPIRYQDNFYTALPHITALFYLGNLLGASSYANLVLGNFVAASQDILTLNQLSLVIKNEPLLISNAIRISLLRTALTPLNQGCANQQWNSNELVTFQQALQKTELVQHLPDILRGERACVDSASLLNLREIIGLSEKSSLFERCIQFFFRNSQKAYYDAYIQHLIDSIYREDQRGLNITTLFQDRSSRDYHPKGFSQRRHFIAAVIVLLESSTIGINIQKTIEAQTQVNQTLIACALERYRLANGSYPASLEILVPDFLSAIPKEPTTGNPMHYRLLADNKFLLWAPGWKLQTRDGKPGEFQGEGDIVWHLPLSQKSRQENPVKP